MTRLVPPDARPAVWGSADVDGSGVGEALARLGACSELGCPLATEADAARDQEPSYAYSTRSVLPEGPCARGP